MTLYQDYPKFLLAVDCIIFGFNGEHLEVLLVKRGFEPEINKWSLMGGFVRENERPEQAADRVLQQLTGLNDVYMELCGAFGEPNRDYAGRVVSICYFALIDSKKTQEIVSEKYEAQWFPISEFPELIFDHNKMVSKARRSLRMKAALYPILFELLPEKFTIPQIIALYEGVYDTALDKRNFIRKLSTSGLLNKTSEKDKSGSKKGAFYYTLNTEVYKEKIMTFLQYLPSWNMD
ncbi:NUDIX hydrolase [Sphingobacterium lactis]|uniref:ADP-ribose pyrophosphatase YjhB, NUDIX family n=1 Tax=Sphingobacterium lactis TaxID=797291 RepID=A0A1H6C4Y8_9SPHI|nr:NUDIX domain-containing protein [Sphingobacterium lactis]SEG67963.1 ADP-ribose pyrophosphatase YjhB, NUDIX family [Sphingobacterium lactis]